MSQFVVGVSGGIGSGKTTVTDLFMQKNIDVIDADVIARQVVEPGTIALEAIVEKFGESILNAKGELDRAQLRSVIFDEQESNPLHKTWLNDLLHPIIRQQMMIQTKAAESIYCLLSVPLLVENNLVSLVDRVLIVDVKESVQLQRAITRDGSNGNNNEQQIRGIMNAQATRKERLKVADDVIDNNGNLTQLMPQIAKLHEHYLQLAT
jgi:dephospho-CoA kinase